MKQHLSTFDKLVETLSGEEAQQMLAKIKQAINTNEELQIAPSSTKSEILKSDFTESRLENEPFLFRLWLTLKAFFKSLPVESLYETSLLNRLGRALHAKYKDYINIRENSFKKGFYDGLKSLRKTQVFFDSLLTAYDNDKGDFYLLLSSFIAPEAHKKLMEESDPFTVQIGTESSANLRSDFLRRIDNAFSALTDDNKSQLYRAAQAIEWMKSFCDIPIEKMLLHFTISSDTEAVCPVILVQSELEKLACVLCYLKQIPEPVLQGLFFLKAQNKFENGTSDNSNAAVEFLEQAAIALSAVKKFAEAIPIVDFTRFCLKDLHWHPYSVAGAEEWFILFKNAWKKRFNEKWSLWTAEQKRFALKGQMLALLKKDHFEEMQYKPWEDIWYPLVFKRELSFVFLKNFFNSLYPSSIQPPLKIILVEGSFYRRENLAEFSEAFNALGQMKLKIAGFEEKLAPAGEIGGGFNAQKKEPVATIKNKETLETLIRTVDSEASILIESALNAFKSIDTILTGIVGGSKASIYATLVNWGAIQGNSNSAFRKNVEEAKRRLQTAVGLLIETENMELHNG
ncbi:DUF5312 domain-containing protein [Treponema phagedenis]|uniref:DUF5312 domain-containing protein n=1 Tax=Treponema phagedenis TaxID=162 RepID=UPI0011E6D901|nr:DUF5312 domain-containing protein [Treponema phagedenis]QEK01625.1 hypothetical protein FUT84_10965 [Treponema phagedenis]QEK06748.1 hypothetical protein FUT80_08475 [Treponema phagedenis]